MNVISLPSTLAAMTTHRPKIHFQSTAFLLGGSSYPLLRAWLVQVPRRAVFKPSKNVCSEGERRRRRLSSCCRRRYHPLLLRSRCRSSIPLPSSILHCPFPICQSFHIYVGLSADAFCVQLITVCVPLVETALKKSLPPFTSSNVATSTASIA